MSQVLRVGVTGASGFVGQAVVAALRRLGHIPIGFSRHPARPIAGCEEVRLFAPPELPAGKDLDAIIHLAGENILGWWSKAKKNRIYQSRIEGTAAVAQAVAEGGFGGVLLQASAVGYFGDTGEQAVDEFSPSGSGFLADVSRDWEAAAEKAKLAGARVCAVRIGMVLGSEGAMKLLRPVFSLGLGGRLGSGQQWMSPVQVHDVAGLFLHLLQDAKSSGPYHAVLPEPVRNRDFTRALGHIVRRPTPWLVPSWCLRLALGEFSTLLLQSSRVLPRRTLECGYSFTFPTLSSALTAAVSRL